jgi:gliding motility-associated lipoprotein GldH
MRILFFFLITLVFFSCDSNRVYEKNQDLEERAWLSTQQPAFEFVIQDTTQAYNLYCNIRNAVTYPYSRIFINYSVQDSAGVSVTKNMISAFLFEEKTGKPFGSSGLGDVYDHQIPLLKNYTFKKSGQHAIRFDQFMRTDTLSGILAVGFRLERAVNE